MDARMQVGAPGPHTGRNHPNTSHEAADAVAARLSALQSLVLAAFRRCGDMTDEELYRLMPFNDMAESTARKRRTELTQLGYLEAKGTKPNSRGRNMNVYGLVRGVIDPQPNLFDV